MLSLSSPLSGPSHSMYFQHLLTHDCKCACSRLHSGHEIVMTACRTSTWHAAVHCGQCCAMAGCIHRPLLTTQVLLGSFRVLICLLPPCPGSGLLLLCCCKVLLVRRSGCTSTTRAAGLSVEARLYAAGVMASAIASASVSRLGTTRGRLGSIWASPISPNCT